MARIGILALLITSLLGACSSPSVDHTISPSAGVSASPSAIVSPLPSASGPASTVAGLPVISVAAADALLRSGKLDGQAAAVAGYYDQLTPSCPYPGRYIGPLVNWCSFVALTDSRATAQLCQPDGSNGVSCTMPSVTNLAPFFMTETSGNAWSLLTGGATGEPAALVLIGHAGDARQWQCTATTQAQCAGAFVVDRIISANGHDLGPTVPQTGDQLSGKPITPRMTLAQVAAAAGLGDDLLTAAAFRAGDIATIDPRWNLAGARIVWLVRSLGPAAQAGSAETRSEIVWLIDDTTGQVIDSHPLKLASDYQPARLWPMATVHEVECCAGNVFPFYRVTSADGTVLYEGLVSQASSGGSGYTTYGGGYGSGVLVLPAGTYSITVWLATYDGRETGTPRDECSTHVSLRPLGDIALNADYPPDKACTFEPAPLPSPGT
jgi:hypothetical protein